MHISVARLAGRWNVSRGPLGSPPTFYKDVCAGPTGLQTVFLRRAYGLWPLRTSQRWGHQSGRTDPRGPHQNKLGWPGPASLRIISMGSKPPLLWFEPRFYHLLKCVCGVCFQEDQTDRLFPIPPTKHNRKPWTSNRKQT